DREGAPPGQRDVLVDVLRLAAEVPLRGEAEQIDPQPPEPILAGRADCDLLHAEDREGPVAHAESPACSLNANAFSKWFRARRGRAGSARCCPGGSPPGEAPWRARSEWRGASRWAAPRGSRGFSRADRLPGGGEPAR